MSRNENGIQLVPVSALYKVLPYAEPFHTERGSFLRGESYDFQIAYKSEHIIWNASIRASGELAQFLTIREELLAPVTFTAEDADDYYLEEGRCCLIPDALAFPRVTGLNVPPDQWRAVWVMLEVPDGYKAGDYRIRFEFVTAEGEVLAETSFIAELIDARLPETDLRLTNWIHYDCIAYQHAVALFGDDFYRVFGAYLETYTKIGFNMLLTPLFTPPLDTEVGGERTTAQLVKIEVTPNGYRFDFSEFRKFIRFAGAHGIKYFELSHLFTQWGGKATPKIVAEENGEEKRIFGWDVPSDSKKYREFLAAFLPSLTRELKKIGIKEKCVLHLTDEPSKNDLGAYAKCRALVKEYTDIPVFDALSNYEFYKEGYVDLPVVLLDAVKEFEAHGKRDIFVYNCCLPAGGYFSNRFINMPSERTRVLGVQLYESGATGYLHWGFNFHNSYLSKEPIDPYKETDAAGAYPCGDGFIVYPNGDGVNLSLRAEIVKAGFNDYRALRLLGSLIGRNAVLSLLYEKGYSGFTNYPHSASDLQALRESVNIQIKNLMNRKGNKHGTEK